MPTLKLKTENWKLKVETLMLDLSLWVEEAPHNQRLGGAVGKADWGGCNAKHCGRRGWLETIGGVKGENWKWKAKNERQFLIQELKNFNICSKSTHKK